jgi:general nucleoside transport system permease protein
MTRTSAPLAEREAAPSAAHRTPDLLNRGLRSTGKAVGPVILIVVITAVAIVLAGVNPLQAFYAAYNQTVSGVPQIGSVLTLSVPLSVAALGVSLAFRAGLFNIGGEGQIAIGAMASAIVGASVSIWSPLDLAATLLAGTAAGALVAAFLAFVRERWGVDEVVTSLLSNYIIVLLLGYLANYVFLDRSQSNPATAVVRPGARFGTLVPGTQLTWSLVLVVVLFLAVGYVIRYSKLGADWKLLGQNPSVARATGFATSRLSFAAMTASGALGGTAGALIVMSTQHRYFVGLGVGLGFNAVLVAMIANYRALPVAIWSIIFSLLSIGGNGVEYSTGIPAEVVQVVLAVVILFIAVRQGMLNALFGRLRAVGARFSPGKAR